MIKSWDTKKYFDEIKSQIDKEYEIANQARSLGIDPVRKSEVLLAGTMAEKCVSLVSTIYPNLPVKKITERILELEDEYGQLDTTVSFVIAREIADNRFCKFKEKIEGIDVGIRVGFSYLTLGVVASPIEGYTGIEVKKRLDGKEYLEAKFSGPIRSAGTTSSCLVLFLIDYLREYFGYEKYDATEKEVERYIAENTDYHERVTNLQYFPTKEEMRFLATGLPIQISGEPTESKEVSNYKDLKRVDTNFIRGGMCLIFSEGLAQKAVKALGRLRNVKKNGINCSGWDYLEGYVEIFNRKNKSAEDVSTYIKDLVAGRPVYGHPGRSGGFRLRYGRSRTSGFSAVSIHPATMGVTNGFLSNGTQLRLEKPIKGCIVTSCDSIEGPTVRLKNGSVLKVKTYEEGKKLYEEIDEIVYLGDILISVGDVIDRNVNLMKPGYVEEWWEKEFSIKNQGVCDTYDSSWKNKKLDFENAVRLSKEFNVPLHPDFIFYWSQIGFDEFVCLTDWLKVGAWRAGKVVLPWNNSDKEKFAVGKRALEILGVEHLVHIDNVVIGFDAEAFLYNLGIGDLYNEQNIEVKFSDGEKDVLKIVNSICEAEIKDKAGTFIGSRMGRPEKAKLRKLVGSPNVLFPVGEQGGRLNNIHDAVSLGFVKSDFASFSCECGNESIYEYCDKCGKKSERIHFCKKCNEIKTVACKIHDEDFGHHVRKIDIKRIFEEAVSNLGYKDFEVSPTVKGVKKLNNDDKICENLAKGILRAKFNLSVNKDGTVRYDGTEIPITHFTSKEIGTSISKLKELGYLKDIYGKDLENEHQILELKPHDIIIPKVSIEDDKINPFVNMASFVDEELERLYKLPRYYNVKVAEDVVGKMVVCIAPHNCAGVVGRIIGRSSMQGILATPYMHAAIRRDCDGDEMAVMFLMDVLLNFSRKYLPSHRGATQDTPLVLNSHIKANEVDDQILSLDVGESYSLNFYEKAEKQVHSSEIKIDTIGSRMRAGETEPFLSSGFTHGTSDINLGNNNGIYKTIPTMKEKVDAQMELVEKIRAVETDDVARLILERHFIRDIRGNLRKFFRQQFRCSGCNEKFRRIPMSGVCDKCGGKIIFTISEGSIKKYLEPALELSSKYNISSYMRESIELTVEYIESLFGKGEVDSRLDEY